MAKYEVITPLRMGGSRRPIPPGAIVELDEQDGAPLERLGALRLVPDTSASAVIFAQAGGQVAAALDQQPVLSIETAKKLLQDAGYAVLTADELGEVVANVGHTAISVYRASQEGEQAPAVVDGAGDLKDATAAEAAPGENATEKVATAEAVEADPPPPVRSEAPAAKRSRKS